MEQTEQQPIDWKFV